MPHVQFAARPRKMAYSHHAASLGLALLCAGFHCLWRPFIKEAFDAEVVDGRLGDDGAFAHSDAHDVHAFAALCALGLPRLGGRIDVREERAEPLIPGARGGCVKPAVPDSHEPAG